MATVHRFADLEVWKIARDFCRDIFKITCYDLFSKDFKLRDQIRAASGSVMDNIAEGFNRGGNKEFIQFLYIAKGSCNETRSQLYRSFDYGYIDVDDLNRLNKQDIDLCNRIENFIAYLKQTPLTGKKYKPATKPT